MQYATTGGKATLAALNAVTTALVTGAPTFADIFDETQIETLHRRLGPHFDPATYATSTEARRWHDALSEAGLSEMASLLDPWLPFDPKVTTIASRAVVHAWAALANVVE